MSSNDTPALVSSRGSPPPAPHAKHGELGSPDSHTPLLRVRSERTTYLSTSFADTALPDVPPSDCRAASPPASQITNSDSRGVCLTLQNSGSVARDHLASERTFLAYVRTSLCIASVGVASKSSLEIYARPLAVSFILLALYVLIMGVFRYFCIQTSLVQGTFPVSRLGLAGIVLGLTVLVVFVFGLLMVEGREE